MPSPTENRRQPDNTPSDDDSFWRGLAEHLGPAGADFILEGITPPSKSPLDESPAATERLAERLRGAVKEDGKSGS
jgi:hypothetical protein